MKPPLAHLLTAISAAALTAIFSGCATESTEQVDARQLFQAHKGATKQEFIGFADGRAFEVVTLIPFAPWSIPKTVIRWCPLYELSPEQFETLKSRMKIPKAPTRG